jgi:hypothetical protein
MAKKHFWKKCGKKTLLKKTLLEKVSQKFTCLIDLRTL